jgi:hypothetical protein
MTETSTSSTRSPMMHTPLPRTKRIVKRIPNVCDDSTSDVSLSSDASTSVNDKDEPASRSYSKTPKSVLRTRQHDSYSSSTLITKEKSFHYQSSPLNPNMMIRKDSNMEDVSSTKFYFSIPSSPQYNSTRTKTSYNFTNKMDEVTSTMELNSIHSTQLRKSDTASAMETHPQALSPPSNLSSSAPSSNKSHISRTNSENIRQSQEKFREILSLADKQSVRSLMSNTSLLETSGVKLIEKRNILNYGSSEMPSASTIKIDLPPHSSQLAQSTMRQSRPQSSRYMPSPVRSLEHNAAEIIQIGHNESSDFVQIPRIIRTSSQRLIHDSHSHSIDEFAQKDHEIKVRLNVKGHSGVKPDPAFSHSPLQLAKESETSDFAKGKMRVDVKSSPSVHIDIYRSSRNQNPTSALQKLSQRVRSNLSPLRSSSESSATFSHLGNLKSLELQQAAAQRFKYSNSATNSEPEFLSSKHRDEMASSGSTETTASELNQDFSSRNNQTTQSKSESHEKNNSLTTTEPDLQSDNVMQNQEEAMQEISTDDESPYSCNCEGENVPHLPTVLAVSNHSEKISLPPHEINSSINVDASGVKKQEPLAPLKTEKQPTAALQAESQILPMISGSKDADNLIPDQLALNTSLLLNVDTLPSSSPSHKASIHQHDEHTDVSLSVEQSITHSDALNHLTLLSPNLLYDTQDTAISWKSSLSQILNVEVSPKDENRLLDPEITLRTRVETENSTSLFVSTNEYKEISTKLFSPDTKERLKSSSESQFLPSDQATTVASDTGAEICFSGEEHEPEVNRTKHSQQNNANEQTREKGLDDFVDFTPGPSDLQELSEEVKDIETESKNSSELLPSNIHSGVSDFTNNLNISKELQVIDCTDAAIDVLCKDASSLARDDASTTKPLPMDPIALTTLKATADAYLLSQGQESKNASDKFADLADRFEPPEMKAEANYSDSVDENKTFESSNLPSYETKTSSDVTSHIENMSQNAKSSNIALQKPLKTEIAGTTRPPILKSLPANRKFIPIDPKSPEALDALAEAYAASRAIDQEAKKLEQLNKLYVPAVDLKQIGPVSEQRHLQVVQLNKLLDKRFPLFLATTVIEILHFIRFRTSSTLLRFFNLILAVSLYSCVLDRHVQRSPLGMMLNRIAAWLLALLALSISYLSPSDKTGSLDLVNYVGFLIFPLALVDSIGVWMDEIRHRSFQWKGFVFESVYVYGCLICIPAIQCLWGINISLRWAETIYIVSIFTALIVAIEYWCVGQVAVGYLPKSIGQSITFFLWGFCHTPGCALLVGLWNGILVGGYVYVGLTVLFLVGRVLEDTLESCGWLQYHEQVQSKQRGQQN